MDVRFVAPDLRRLDRLKSEALSIPFFEDERPLRGALGLVDWRMAGRLSVLLRAGRLTGREGEKVLVRGRPKLVFDKLFLFGLGPRDAFDDACFDRVTRTFFETWSRAQVRASVCVLPGRASALIEPARAMERFLALAADTDIDEITLLEDAEAQKVMTPIFEAAKRKARAQA